MRLQLLSTEIQKLLAPKPLSGEVKAYYEKKRRPSSRKPGRDIHLIVNKNRAKAEQAKNLLEKENPSASWKKVAKKYPTDPTSKSRGGLLENPFEGTLGEPQKARFSAPRR